MANKLVRINHYQEGIDYAHQVVRGDIRAPQYQIKVCQRFLDYLEKTDWRWTFNTELAQHPITWFNQLKLSKGPDAGRPFVLQPFQVFLLIGTFGFVDKKDPQLRMVRNAGLYAPRKCGKALDVDTPIATDDGWSTMGQIEVGQKIFSSDGSITSVIAKSEVFVVDDCYLLTFSNGDSLVANKDHLWRVNDRYLKKSVLRTTEQLFNRVTLAKRTDRNERNLSISMPRPQEGKSQSLEIAPYTLGVWLGDGTACRPNLTLNKQDSLEILSFIDDDGYFWHYMSDKKPGSVTISFCDRYEHKKIMADKLTALGVLNNKHIPTKYLRASYADRLALLQGLMDTDGCCNPEGKRLEFVTIKPDFAKGFGELLSTFGIKWKMHEKFPLCNGKRLDYPAYIFSFTAFKDEIPCFRLKRKLACQRNNPHQKTRSRTLQIISIKKVFSRPTQCLQVDHPSGMFLAGKTMIPTHNSEISAGIAAYILKFGEIGTQVFSLGLDRAQASLIFNTCKTMIQNGPRWISQSYCIRQFDITCPSTEGVYRALSRDSRKSADGLNPELVLADESAQLSREMIEVMESGMVARKSPLIFHTTTAAFDKTTKFYENLSYYKNMLDGIVEDNPRFFFCVFELDEGLDWKDPAYWDMVNPMYGISVFKEAIEERVKEAMAKPSMVNEVLTKTFNRYTSNERTWIDTKHWEDSPRERPMGDPEKVFMAIDLSLSRDLCCVALLERFEMEQYYASFQFFLPEEGLEHIPVYERGIFNDSIAKGTLKLTPGNVADYEEVEKYISKICSERQIYMIGYDAWNASALVTKLHERGLPLKKIGQNIGTLSAPTKQLEKLIYSHSIGHEHDPMMLFQLQNCSLYEDPNLNIKIKRPAFAPHAKIDGVVCLIMGVYLSLEVPQTSLLRFDLL